MRRAPLPRPAHKPPAQSENHKPVPTVKPGIHRDEETLDLRRSLQQRAFQILERFLHRTDPSPLKKRRNKTLKDLIQGNRILIVAGREK